MEGRTASIFPPQTLSTRRRYVWRPEAFRAGAPPSRGEVRCNGKPKTEQNHDRIRGTG
jgi:hypothetical protein